jgi:hypothetical protein
MPKIAWSSLIADGAGNIDLDKLSKVTAIFLALLAGLVVITGAVLEMLFKVQLPDGHTNTAVWALVVPLTGGKIATAIVSRKAPVPVVNNASPEAQ